MWQRNGRRLSVSSEVPHDQGRLDGTCDDPSRKDPRDSLGFCELSGRETSKQLKTELQCWIED